MPPPPTITRPFLFALRQEPSAFSGIKNAPQKIMLLLSCIALATSAAAPPAAPAVATTTTPPAPLAPARALVVPAAFTFRGSLPHLAPNRRPPQQAVQQRRDGRTVGFFSTSQGSTTTTTLGMATRHWHEMAGEARGRRRAGGGGGTGVIRSRAPPSVSPGSLRSAMGVLSPRSLRSAVGVLWGVGGEIGGGRDRRGDDESEINERDGDDDVDIPSEHNSLERKEVVDGTPSTGGTSTGAPRVDKVFDRNDGKGRSTPPPPLAFSEAKGEKTPPTGSGEEASSRRGLSDSTDWMPQLFPPSSVDDDNDSFIKPLIELPLDGILLQLFPALLIGVLGLFLTFAVQMQASRFDGMVGEDGGAVVVTDLRETRKAEP